MGLSALFGTLKERSAPHIGSPEGQRRPAVPPSPLLDLPASALAAVVERSDRRSRAALRLACAPLRAAVDAQAVVVDVGACLGHTRPGAVAARFPNAREVRLRGLAAAAPAPRHPAAPGAEAPLHRLLDDLALLDAGAWPAVLRVAGCAPSAPLLRLLAAAAPALEAVCIGAGAAPQAAGALDLLRALVPVCCTLRELSWSGWDIPSLCSPSGARAGCGSLLALTALRRLRLRAAAEAGGEAAAADAALAGALPSLAALTHLTLEFDYQYLERGDRPSLRCSAALPSLTGLRELGLCWEGALDALGAAMGPQAPRLECVTRLELADYGLLLRGFEILGLRQLLTISECFPSLRHLHAPRGFLALHDGAPSGAAAAAGTLGRPPLLAHLTQLCVGQCCPALARLAPSLRVLDLKSDDVGLSHLSQREPHGGVEELCLGLPAGPCDPGPGGDGLAPRAAAAPLIAFAQMPSPGSFPALRRVRLRGGGELALRLMRELPAPAAPRLAELSVEWAADGGAAPLGRALQAILPVAPGLRVLRVLLFQAGRSSASPAVPGGACGGGGLDPPALSDLVSEIASSRLPMLKEVEIRLPAGAVSDPAVSARGIDSTFWAWSVAISQQLPWLTITDGG